jgi:hypothetical protein
MIVKLRPARGRGLSVLVAGMAGIEDLSVCVQSALGTLVAIAGGAGQLDCIDEGRVKASVAGDFDLADLLRRALEELESELLLLDEPAAPLAA